MSDVQLELKREFDEAVGRAHRDGSLENAIRRGAALRRRRLAAYATAAAGSLVAIGIGFAALLPSSGLSNSTFEPAAPGESSLPAARLTTEDRAALTAQDAVFAAMDLPRADDRYPFFGGIRRGEGSEWVALFDLMKCDEPESCADESLISVRVDVDGDVGRVVDVTGQLTQSETDAILNYSRSYPEGARGFEITDSWLWNDLGGVAIGSISWRGTVPTYGYEYLCTATVLDADGDILYEGSRHEVVLPAPSLQRVRSGLVGVPVEISPAATSVEVSCDDERPAPIPMHTP